MCDVVIAPTEAEARRIFFENRIYLNSEFRDTEELQNSTEDYSVVNIWVVEEEQE